MDDILPPQAVGRLCRVPPGTLEMGPAYAGTLAHFSRSARARLHAHGYEPVMTPSFEYQEALGALLVPELRRAGFRAVDGASGEALLMRPDFTAQVIRLVRTQMHDAPRPLRLWYEGRVLRGQDLAGRGLALRDRPELGIELIGSGRPSETHEVLSLATTCLLEACPPSDLAVHFGHAGWLQAMLPPDPPDALLDALRAKDPGAVSAVAPELEILATLHGGVGCLERARVLSEGRAAALGLLEDLAKLADQLKSEHPDIAVRFDLGEPRGLKYYTGPYFVVHGEGALRPLAAGGRYDGLLPRMGLPEAAVGVSLHLDSVADVYRRTRPAEGVVLGFRDDAEEVSARCEADALRQTGVRAVVIPAEQAKAYAEANRYEECRRWSEGGWTAV